MQCHGPRRAINRCRRKRGRSTSVPYSNSIAALWCGHIRRERDSIRSNGPDLENFRRFSIAERCRTILGHEGVVARRDDRPEKFSEGTISIKALDSRRRNGNSLEQIEKSNPVGSGANRCRRAALRVGSFLRERIAAMRRNARCWADDYTARDMVEPVAALPASIPALTRDPETGIDRNKQGT